jgi:hypothetical protein
MVALIAILYVVTPKRLAVDALVLLVVALLMVPAGVLHVVTLSQAVGAVVVLPLVVVCL